MCMRVACVTVTVDICTNQNPTGFLFNSHVLCGEMIHVHTDSHEWLVCIIVPADTKYKPTDFIIIFVRLV